MYQYFLFCNLIYYNPHLNCSHKIRQYFHFPLNLGLISTKYPNHHFRSYLCILVFHPQEKNILQKNVLLKECSSSLILLFSFLSLKFLLLPLSAQIFVFWTFSAFRLIHFFEPILNYSNFRFESLILSIFFLVFQVLEKLKINFFLLIFSYFQQCHFLRRIRGSNSGMQIIIFPILQFLFFVLNFLNLIILC